MNITETVQNTISEHNLISPGDRVLVALSGGSDSVALIHILKELSEKSGFSLAAAHVNHCLRETALRDMKFSETLCNELGIEFHCKICDIKTEAAQAKMSEELYARKIRYDFFASLSYDKIATAHNKNDNAETILFHFIRGSSIGGLSGIPYQRDNIIRPMLDVKKTDIELFCKDNGYTFVTDETNFMPIYSRNILRLNTIPEIEKKLNGGFCDTVTENAKYYKEDADFLDNIAKDKYIVPLKAEYLNTLSPPVKRRVIQLHFKNSTNRTENLSSGYIGDIISLCKKNRSSSRISLPDGYEAVTEYGTLKIDKKKTVCEYEYRIYPNIPLAVPEAGKTVTLLPHPHGEIHLDPSATLTVRNRRSGDVFFPVKMTGRKKLSDFFTDKKIPASKRDEIPVLLSNGEIVSIMGMRNDRRFSDLSKPAYKIEIKEF